MGTASRSRAAHLVLAVNPSQAHCTSTKNKWGAAAVATVVGAKQTTAVGRKMPTAANVNQGPLPCRSKGTRGVPEVRSPALALQRNLITFAAMRYAGKATAKATSLTGGGYSKATILAQTIRIWAGFEGVTPIVLVSHRETALLLSTSASKRNLGSVAVRRGTRAPYILFARGCAVFCFPETMI
eukprot:CAMPEP_0171783624 /NCGR_PEP_ID=MMETSP0991-20121206/61596_1 /TAXON_ID=483369 /ORGANISM="non described non described, Strain CCMP2098" /LENGTH=183 /DNA_ID=CAMNT_0012391781 /DNA_START=33 /DNA_END=584 /DNA_ORIENTATION=+